MKSILIFLIPLIVANRSFAAQEYQQYTDRMKAIEDTFSLKMMMVEKNGDSIYWIFLASSQKGRFGVIPVAVPADASDSDVLIAMISSATCAMFYETKLPGAKKVK